MQRSKKFIAFVAASMAAGCAMNSGVVKIGPETYMVSRQAATGFFGLASLKAKAFREAGAYCSAHGMQVDVVNTNESQPPYILGNYPRADIQFRCLKAGDPALTRPTLHPES